MGGMVAGAPEGKITIVEPSDLSASWLGDMEKLCVQVARRGNRNGLEHLAHVSAVVRTMCDDVQKHLFAGHGAGVAVGEAKRNSLAKLAWRNRCDMFFVPDVRFSDAELKLIDFGRGVSVCGRIAMRLAQQVSLEDAVNHVDVIERTDCGVNGCCVLSSGNCSKDIKQFVICPRFLREE